MSHIVELSLLEIWKINFHRCLKEGCSNVESGNITNAIVENARLSYCEQASLRRGACFCKKA